MMKRLRWMTIGAALGIWGYIRLTNKAREKVPEARQAALRARGSLRQMSERFVAVLREESGT